MKKKVVNSVNFYFQEFISEREYSGLSPATIKAYKDAFAKYILDTDGSLSRTSFYTWVDSMKHSCPNSINHYLGHMRVFVNYCIENNYIEPFKIKLMKQQEGKIVYYTDEELQILLQKPKSGQYREFRTWVIINLMLATGARIGTILELKISDLDLKAQELTYSHLKNKKLAIIPLSNAITKVLREYLNTWDLTEYLFADVNYNKMTYNCARMALEVYCKDRKVDCKGLHAFRHTYARLWILNNGNVFSLQQMLCHSDISMTRRYANIFGQDLHNGLEQFTPLDNLQKNRVKKKGS